MTKRKAGGGIKRSQIISLQDFLHHQQHPREENQSNTPTSVDVDTAEDLDIDAICAKYNITDLVPESVKWVILSKNKNNKKTSERNSETLTRNQTETDNHDDATIISICTTPSSPTTPLILVDDVDPIVVDSPQSQEVEEIQEQPQEHKCQSCHKVFKNMASMKKHCRLYCKKNNTNSNNCFPCTICGNRFGSAESLSCHDRIHQRGRKYGCDICGLRFVLHREAIAHAKAHTGERPFGCLICGLAFRLGSSLNLHMKWKHKGNAEGEDEIKKEEPEIITID